MALQSTSKIRLYISSQKEVEVLSFLQEKGVMEVVPVEGSDRTDISQQAGFNTAKLDFAIRYLKPFTAEKKGLRNSVLGEKLEISEKEAEEKISGFDWEKAVETVSALELERNDLNRGLIESKMALKTLSSFKGVSTTATKGAYSSSFFVVPTKNAEIFVTDVREVSPYLEITEETRTESSVSFVLFSRDSEKSEILLLLAQAKGSEIELESGLSPVQKIEALEKNIAQMESQLSKNFDSATALAESIDKLKMCHDQFASEKEVNISRRGMINGAFISVIEGWAATSTLELLKKDLSSAFGAVEIEEIEKGEKEVARVILAPSGFMAPIMEITKMYGTPKIEEIDPTPYYAFFFVLFFGFCLTDAGYGLILMAMTSTVLALKLPLAKNVKAMIQLFLYGGISTFILGVLFGGWLGLTTEQVPEFLTYVRDEDGVMTTMFLGQIFNPMTDLVTKIMPVTYILGVVHLSLGVFLSGLIKWKSGDKNRMLFVAFPIISLFIFASLAWVMKISGFDYAFYAALVVAIWGLGESGNPVIRMLKGFGGLLNEALGWFSNILSYSRLFALGLATGIIAMAFNIVAVTVGDMIPGIFGFLVMVFVLAFGHTLNIALNLLGAYVHSSRLQFVEFFGMFLEGGGRRFNPLKKVNRFRFTD